MCLVDLGFETCEDVADARTKATQKRFCVKETGRIWSNTKYLHKLGIFAPWPIHMSATIARLLLSFREKGYSSPSVLIHEFHVYE